MDLTTVLVIILVLYFIYEYTPIHCVFNPGQCIREDINSVKSFFGDLISGVKNTF